jgi:hypothetical protein
MAKSFEESVLDILLRKLQSDISRNDGTAALATIDQIRDVAGIDYANALMDRLIDNALNRLTGR